MRDACHVDQGRGTYHEGGDVGSVLLDIIKRCFSSAPSRPIVSPSLTGLVSPSAPSIPPLPRVSQATGSKVLGGDATRARRADELKTDASRLEMSIVAAKAEYDRIKAANLQVRERGGR